MFVPWCFGQCDHYPKLSKYLLSFWVHTSRCVHHNSLTVRLYVVCKSRHHNSNCDAQLEQQPINSTLHTQSTVWGNGLQPSQSGAGCRPSPASSRSKEPFNNAVQLKSNQIKSKEVLWYNCRVCFPVLGHCCPHSHATSYNVCTIG